MRNFAVKTPRYRSISRPSENSSARHALFWGLLEGPVKYRPSQVRPQSQLRNDVTTYLGSPSSRASAMAPKASLALIVYNEDDKCFNHGYSLRTDPTHLIWSVNNHILGSKQDFVF